MSRIVGAARSWIGTPYVHGASVRGAGADCLGLVRGVWRDVLGREPEPVPIYTRDWSEPQGDEALLQAATRLMRTVPQDRELVEGEVLLFRMRSAGVAKHLGVLTEGGEVPRFVHAYDRRGVVENYLTAPWRRRLAARFDFPTED